MAVILFFNGWMLHLYQDDYTEGILKVNWLIELQ